MADLHHSATIGDVLTSLDTLAPPETAEDWDNVGLLVGDSRKTTTGAIVSIDLTEEAVQLAKKLGYSLIINHHPCIFPRTRGLSRMLAGSPVFQAVQEGIAVAAYHTNFDQCALEVIHSLAPQLSIQPRGRLLETQEGSLAKLVVFVPESHLEQVRAALTSAGAGQIGQYDSCTFSVLGEGTFRGGEGSNPFLGTKGKLEKVSEFRLETIIPSGLRKPVVQALLRAHPYEEVAYDLYPVSQRPGSLGCVRGLGYGFWGDLAEPKDFSEIAKDVKKLFKLEGFWLTHPAPSQVKRIGFVAGKGASFLAHAASVGCDLFITGEVGYHAALESVRRNVSVMEIGHRESELFFVKTMKQWLSQQGIGVAELSTPTQSVWQEVKQ